MNELRKIALGEPIIGTTDGDDTMTTPPVLMDSTVIGSIIDFGNMCNWQADSLTSFVVPPLLDWSRDSLLATLDAMIDRQAKRLATGETLRAGDKNPLDPDLHMWMDGEHLRHPLVYAIPYSCHMASHYNTLFRVMRQKRAEALAAGDWATYIWIHQRPYRLAALTEIVDRLSDQEYWNLVGNFWVDSENIHQNTRTWRTLWSSKRPGREAVMDDDEREALAGLPEMVPIYRGFLHSKSARGMAWTLDRDKAVWFARRFASFKKSSPRVASAMVARQKILAHFTGRSEQEVVVLSRDLQNFSIEAIER